MTLPNGIPDGAEADLSIHHIHITIASFSLFRVPPIIERSERP